MENEIQLVSFFIFMKELKNELLKQIKINFMIIFTSIVCTLLKSKFVPGPLRLCNGHADTKNPLFRKQLI